MYQKVDGKWVLVNQPPAINTSRVGRLTPAEMHDMLRKYSGPRKKRVKVEEVKPVEWVDTSYIKEYNDQTSLEKVLNQLVDQYPEITKRLSLGVSVEGRQLAGIVIGHGVRQGRPVGRPQVKYVANIHGDEVVGREMLIGLARYLTENYGNNDRITAIVDSTEIHLLPSINPDGFYKDTRHNVNDEDLNRSFPGWRDLGLTREELFHSGFVEMESGNYELVLQEREPEVAAMMTWCLDNSFVFSISFHDGRVMVNYPWDDSPTAEEGHAAVCPDDAVFSELAQLYSEWHTFMWTGKCLCHSETFTKGISNGAEWYLVDNGMQDFNYLFTNCLEITVELSCTKRPLARNLQAEWENNLDSMLALLESVQGGIRGLVVDQDGNPLEGAVIQVAGLDKDVTSTARGEYWRLLTPGTYRVRAIHTEVWGVLESEEIQVEVVNSLGKGAIQLNFIARIRLEERFIVTGVKLDGCRLLDHKYIPEVGDLFTDCRVTQVDLYAAECRRVPNDPSNRQVAFLVDIVMSPLPMFQFFYERWGDDKLRRPTNGFQAEKLGRRSKIYSQDRWAGRKGEWMVRLVTGIL